MKKSLLFSGLIALILVLVSCNNLVSVKGSNNGSVVGGGTDVASGSRMLTAKIAGIDSVGSGRLIYAPAFETTDLTYWLVGKNNNSENFSFTNITDKFNAAKTEFVISVSPGIWNFTLYACEDTITPNSSNVESNAQLVGYATVDLSRRSSTANFILTPGKLTTKADVTMNLTANWFVAPFANDFTVKAGIYRLDSGAKVDEQGAGTFDFTTTGGATTATYTKAAVSPGIYTFSVTFTKGEDEFVWSEKLIVEPGHNVEATRTIENFIGEKPAKPTNPFAYYADSKENDYTLGFYWTDSSDNEKYFEIEVADVTNIDDADLISATGEILIKTDTDWASKIGTISDGVATYETGVSGEIYGVSGNSSINWVGGSLLKNNEGFAIKATLGKKYLARIRATNVVGSSDWVYVKRSTDVSGVTLEGVTTPQIFKNKSKAFNLYMMKYNLNHGAYKDMDDNTVSDPYIVYDTIPRAYVTVETTGTMKIMDGTIQIGTELKRNSSKFTGWYILNPERTDVTGMYEGTGNINVYASYDQDGTGTVEIFNKSLYALPTNFLGCSDVGGTTIGITGATPPKVAKFVDVSGTSTANVLDWAINIGAQADPSKVQGTFKYSKLEVKISSRDANIYNGVENEWHNFGVGDSDTLSVPISTWEEGPYVIEFVAYVGSTVVDSRAYAFSIVD